MIQAATCPPRREVRPGLTDHYTPTANVLLRGFPELSATDRYVAISLISLYWDEDIHLISLRELAAAIQVDHTILRSRGGKRPSEGVLDKLCRLGIIGLLETRPLTKYGQPGRPQACLCINYHFIAEQNTIFFQKRREMLHALPGGLSRGETVGNSNSAVEETTTPVGNSNSAVGETTTPVEQTSGNFPHKNLSKNDPKNFSPKIFSGNHATVASESEDQPLREEKKPEKQKNRNPSSSAQPEGSPALLSSPPAPCAEAREPQASLFSSEGKTTSDQSCPLPARPPTFPGSGKTPELRSSPSASQERGKIVRQKPEPTHAQREAELWQVFDRLFGFPVNRLGYNKAHIRELAGNPQATDDLIALAFQAVAADPRTQANPGRLTITTITDELPAHIRAHRIRPVSPAEATLPLLEKLRAQDRYFRAIWEKKQQEKAASGTVSPALPERKSV